MYHMHFHNLSCNSQHVRLPNPCVSWGPMDVTLGNIHSGVWLELCYVKKWNKIWFCFFLICSNYKKNFKTSPVMDGLLAWTKNTKTQIKTAHLSLAASNFAGNGANRPVSDIERKFRYLFRVFTSAKSFLVSSQSLCKLCWAHSCSGGASIGGLICRGRRWCNLR